MININYYNMHMMVHYATIIFLNQSYLTVFGSWVKHSIIIILYTTGLPFFICSSFKILLVSFDLFFYIEKI